MSAHDGDVASSRLPDRRIPARGSDLSRVVDHFQSVVLASEALDDGARPVIAVALGDEHLEPAGRRVQGEQGANAGLDEALLVPRRHHDGDRASHPPLDRRSRGLGCLCQGGQFDRRAEPPSTRLGSGSSSR